MRALGHVFVTSVLLGGQQKTSKFAGAFSIKDEETHEDALRTALGVKIHAQYVSGGTQISGANSNSVSQADSQYTNLAYLGMNASGGDPLIGSE